MMEVMILAGAVTPDTRVVLMTVFFVLTRVLS